MKKNNLFTIAGVLVVVATGVYSSNFGELSKPVMYILYGVGAALLIFGNAIKKK